MNKGKYNENNTYQKRKPFNRNSTKTFSDRGRPFVMNDDFAKELLKNDIDVEKWYHKLLTDTTYYNKLGESFCKGFPVIQKLSQEYNRAMISKSINSMILIKKELFNSMSEQKWIYEYLSGNVCNKSGTPLIQLKPELSQISTRFMEVYNQATNTIN